MLNWEFDLPYFWPYSLIVLLFFVPNFSGDLLSLNSVIFIDFTFLLYCTCSGDWSMDVDYFCEFTFESLF
jgi:hypothetical protein